MSREAGVDDPIRVDRRRQGCRLGTLHWHGELWVNLRDLPERVQVQQEAQVSRWETLRRFFRSDKRVWSREEGGIANSQSQLLHGFRAIGAVTGGYAEGAGAGEGNRTLVISLGSWSNAIIRHPRKATDVVPDSGSQLKH